MLWNCFDCFCKWIINAILFIFITEHFVVNLSYSYQLHNRNAFTWVRVRKDGQTNQKHKHFSSMFKSVNKKIIYCESENVLIHVVCFYLIVIWILLDFILNICIYFNYKWFQIESKNRQKGEIEKGFPMALCYYIWPRKGLSYVPSSVTIQFHFILVFKAM